MPFPGEEITRRDRQSVPRLWAPSQGLVPPDNATANFHQR